MGRPKVIFFTAFFIFNLFLFIFALIVDWNKTNFDFLLALQGRISHMKYYAAIGLLLSISAYAISFFSNRRHKKELEELKKEQNEYKARIFDLQEELKKMKSPVEVTDSPAIEEDPSGKENS